MATKEWFKWHPLTKKVAIFAFCNTVIVPFVLIVILQTPWRQSGLFNTFDRFFANSQGNDSWHPMMYGLHHMRTVQEKTLYEEWFFTKTPRYQYPPTGLLIMAALQRLCPGGVLWEPECFIVRTVLRGISTMCVLITIACAILLLQKGLSSMQHPTNTQFSTADRVVLSVALAGLGFFFYPLMKAFSLGQIQSWINAGFALIFVFWIQRIRIIPGILLGLICLIKAQYSLLFIWALLRKEFRFATAFAVTMIVGLVVSIAMFGLQEHLSYLNVLSFLAKHGEVYYPNHSVNGLVNRILLNGDPITWLDRWAPYHPVVHILTMLSSAALILFALFWRARKEQSDDTADFFLMVLVSTMASPVAWEHHYGILFPIYAFLFPALLKQEVFGKWSLPLLAVSFFLTSHFLSVLLKFAYGYLNVLLSYVFFGAIILLVMLHRLRIRHSHRGKPRSVHLPAPAAL